VSPGERRQVWRRENVYGVRGLDQLAPVDERPLDGFDALVCRVFHRARWQAGIDRYFGHGLAVDFTCSLCDRSWYWYDYEHLWRYRARREREAAR
jgi:hypothetical protein